MFIGEYRQIAGRDKLPQAFEPPQIPPARRQLATINPAAHRMHRNLKYRRHFAERVEPKPIELVPAFRTDDRRTYDRARHDPNLAQRPALDNPLYGSV